MYEFQTHLHILSFERAIPKCAIDIIVSFVCVCKPNFLWAKDFEGLQNRRFWRHLRGDGNFWWKSHNFFGGNYYFYGIHFLFRLAYLHYIKSANKILAWVRAPPPTPDNAKILKALDPATPPFKE